MSRGAAPQDCGALLDACLARIERDAATPQAADLVEPVHRMRVGIRRLLSALRACRGWLAPPPPALVAGLRRQFAALGRARERDVLAAGVAAELARAGAPPLALPGAAEPVDAAAVQCAIAATRALLRDCQAWRAAQAGEPARPGLRRRVRRRLRRWQRRLAAAAGNAEALDEAGLHALRKRIKRQRYAIELFAPLLPRKAAARQLRALAAAQQALGEINDLVVARAAYRARVAEEAGAWFAVGWLTARIAQARGQAGAVLAALGAA